MTPLKNRAALAIASTRAAPRSRLLAAQAMDPLVALLAQPLRLSSALDLHSRITLLEDATRACHAELQRRPTHCQEAPPPQPAAAPSSCMFLLLGHDEMDVVAQELCDPLQPLLAVNLGSTAKGLQMPMQAALAQLKQQHLEAEGFAALVGMDMERLRVATTLRLGSFDGRPLTLAHGRALGTLVGCGSLPMLRNLCIECDECGDEGVVLLAVGLRRGGLPSLGTLRFASSQIGEQAASALAAALTKRAVPALTTLHLGDNELGDLGLVALAPALRQLPTLTELKMWDNEISDRGLAALIAQPMTGVLESLQLLDLCGNNITDAGCAALDSALRSGALPALKAVDLRDDEDDGFSPAHEDMFAARAGLVAFYELKPY